MDITPTEQGCLNRIGLSVKQRRVEKFGDRGLTRCAEVAGVTKSMLRKIEKGEVNPSILILERVCSALECEVGDLY